MTTGTRRPARASRARSRRAGGRREAGQATLELVGVLPVLMIALLLLLQVMVFAYTSHAASQAARDAARAYSLDGSAVGAAQSSLPGGVSLVDVGTFGPGHGVRVTVQAPPVLLMGDRRITRSVVMP